MMNIFNLKRIKSGFEETASAFVDELKAVFSDNGALLIFFVAVFIYPIIYSLAYQKEVVRDIPVTIVDKDNSQLSRQLIRMLDATKEIHVAQEVGSLNEAEQLFWDESSRGVIVIPADFEKNILKGNQAHLSIYCDANYFLVYKETLTGAIQASGTMSAGIEIKRLMAAGTPPEMAMRQRNPLQTSTYMLYNPSGAYGSYVMPGLILVILQQTLLVGIGMVGGGKKERGHAMISLSGERERKTIFPIVFGKALAYFAIYAINIVFTQIYIFKWFGFPMNGSFLNIIVLMVPFIFSVIFMGLAISLLLRRREHSIMLMVFLSPIVLFLSGMSWPEKLIPSVLYKVAHIFPSTSMIPAFLRVQTMGVGLENARPELIFLLVQMIVYCVLAVISYRVYILRMKKNEVVEEQQEI